MKKWEYLTSYFFWHEWRDGGRKRKDWVIEQEDGTHLVGMDNILNHFGSQGWELVNLVQETARGKITHWASAEVKGFRAIFKRCLEEG